MRTERHVLERIAAWSNVRAAWADTRRGKRRRPAIAGFALRAEEEVTRLTWELGTGTWRPGPFRLFVVRDPKPRLIAAAPVRDRVVHHAVHRVLEPLLGSRFLPDSFACRAGMGTHRAVLAFQRGLLRFPWVGRLDVRRFYLEIRWCDVLELVARRVADPGAMALIQRILVSGAGLYADRGLLERLGLAAAYQPEPRKGLPIGALTSQLFGNLILDGLDHFVKRTLRVPLMVRYMDDVVLFGGSLDQVRAWCRECEAWLREWRGLSTRPTGGRVDRTEGSHLYLGQTVSREGRRVCGRTVRRLRARLRAAVREGASPAELRRLELAVASLVPTLVW